MVAGDGARRDDRDEEHRLLDRLRDLRFPQLAGSDGFLVLPQAEISAAAPKLRAEVALDSVAQGRERSSERLVVLARVTEEADEFGKLRQRGHRAQQASRRTNRTTALAPEGRKSTASLRARGTCGRSGRRRERAPVGPWACRCGVEGSNVVGSTSGYYTPEKEKIREAVNDWIRAGVAVTNALPKSASRETTTCGLRLSAERTYD